MKLVAIQRLINAGLAGETYSFKELVPHINCAIDEINAQLNTIFPDIDANTDSDEYIAFPDRYIRSVIVPGAIVHFYTVDEEGNPQSPQYQIDFQRGLFYMLRDYSSQIPTEYLAPSTQGSLTFASEQVVGERGLELYGNNFDI